MGDCRSTLRKQICAREMKVLEARRGENSFIIDIKVEGVPEPWRCFHEGRKYQGEG